MSDSPSNSNPKIGIQTGISPDYVGRILTRDVSGIEAVLDLIDNSVDAIRSALDQSVKDDKGFPKSYKGYGISIFFSEKEFRIVDNGFGIDSTAMVKRLLMIGAESNEHLAIGHFGVGIKRTFLKLGNKYSISTTNSTSSYLIKCKRSDLLKESRDKVFANQVPKLPSLGTDICITSLTTEFIREIGSETWEKTIAREISIRYSLLIRKGLEISLNKEICSAICPGVRDNEVFKPKVEVLYNENNILIDVRSGMHEEYRLTSEPDYEANKSRIKQLTNEYGWYFVCNERVIKTADHSPDFGWSTRWHQEYYGFVGWVFFSGPVNQLPWNTKKTDIDPSSEIFLKVKSKLISFADDYRQVNRKERKQPSGFSGEQNHASLNADRVGETSKEIKTEQVEEGKVSQESIDLQKKFSGENERTSMPEKLGIRGPTKIAESSALVTKLNQLNSLKLSKLYYSLCRISFIEHPILVAVGVWTFVESLSKQMGRNAETSFVSFYKSKIPDWYEDKTTKAEMRTAIERISEEGNCTKHGKAHMPHAPLIADDFHTIEPLLIKSIDIIVESRD